MSSSVEVMEETEKEEEEKEIIRKQYWGRDNEKIYDTNHK